jgi:tetratricopeptide (TPR) repeat protein
MTTDTIEDLFAQAREESEQGNWEKSRQLFLQALNLKPDSPDIHYGLASVCFQMNDLPSASYHFKEVTRLDPLRAGAYINLGAVYNLLDQPDDAIPVLRRGIQLDPQRAEGHYNLAVVYRRKGQPNLALQSYQECLRINPRMADAHFNLANLYIERSDYNQAASHYKLALQTRPNWEKAAKGLQKVQDVMAENARRLEETGRSTEEAPARPTSPAPEYSGLTSFGPLLAGLHKAMAESEHCGKHCLKVLEGEIEPALKGLSTCLGQTGSPVSEVKAHLFRIETAVQNLRNAHRLLQTSMEKLHGIGDRLRDV